MQSPLKLDLPELEWVALCRAEVGKGKSISQVARETGIARSSLSMLLSGTYPAESLDIADKRHAARVVQLYRDQVLCPHLRRGIGAEACRATASAPMSTSSPEKLQQWRACRRCPLNPVSQKES